MVKRKIYSDSDKKWFYYDSKDVSYFKRTYNLGKDDAIEAAIKKQFSRTRKRK